MSTSPSLDAPISARRAQTRERLMQAASAVFADRGVNGASVEEITDAAGFSRGAFYSNFADKNELVLAMLQQSMSTEFAIAWQAVDEMRAAGSTNPGEVITLALTALAQTERPARVGILLDLELKLHAAREPALRAAYLEFTDEVSRRLTDLISSALGFLGLELTVDFDHARRMIVAVHEHEQQQAVFTGRPADNAPLRTLLLAITRPVGEPPAD